MDRAQKRERMTEPYYQDEHVTIYHGDCLDVLPTLDLFATVAVTDPPYGVNLSERHKSWKGHRSVQSVAYASHDDTPEFVADVVVPVVRGLVEDCRRVALTPGKANMFLYPEPSHVGAFYFPAGSQRSSWGFNCWQPVFLYGKDPYLQNGMGGRPDSFQVVQPNRGAGLGHPVAKTIEQMRWLVGRVSVDESDIILDPFMGSGTTLRASKDLGRKSIGIELEEKYCEIAVRRLGQEVLF